MTSRPVCSLTSDPGYVIYSACGSFWVPMLGMVVFYWKIYKTAVAATEAYKRGFVEPKTSGLSSSTSENALCNPLSRADADYFARLRRFSVRGSSSAVASRTDSDVSDERDDSPAVGGRGSPKRTPSACYVFTAAARAAACCSATPTAVSRSCHVTESTSCVSSGT